MPSPSASSKEVRLDLPAGGLRFVTKDMLRRVLRAMGRQLGLDIRIDGATRSSADGNTLTFTVPSGTASAASGLEVSADGRVTAATILGVMPTIGGSAIDDTYTALTISSGTRYVIATVSGTPVATTLSGRVFFGPAMTSISVAITETGTAPDAGDLSGSTGTFAFLLATFVDGDKTAQNGHGPITGFVQDHLDGSGNGTLQLTYAGP